MAVLTPTQIVRSGVEYDEAEFDAATSGGDSIVAAPKVFLAIKNSHATLPRTVTIVTPGEVQGYAIADQPVVVAALTTALIGPFGSVFTNNDHYVTFTYSDAGADLTVAAFTI